MKLIQDFRFGIQAYSKAISYILRTRLFFFLIFPLLFNVLLFYAGWNLVDNLSEQCQFWFQKILPIENLEFSGASFLQKSMNWFINILFKVLFFFLFASLGGYLIIIIMSPVLSYLSEQTEKIQSGNSVPFHFKKFIQSVFRGIFIAMRNFSIELLMISLVLILGLIPIVSWLSGLFLFLISAYFYGFSFFDYAIERKNMNIKESVQFMRNNKGAVIANGFVFSLCLHIPLVGVFFSSFAALVSVVAGSLSANNILEKENKHSYLCP